MSPVLSITDDDLSPLDTLGIERLRLLVFSATWCMPCKAMAPAVDDVAITYCADVAVARIDIEASAGIASRFAVRGVPTLILLDQAGSERLRHVGPLTRTRLSLLLENSLAARSR